MMHPSPRRLALGAGLAVVMAGAVPAFADAASTCSLDPATHRVTVNGSGSQPLRITRSGQFLAVQEGSSSLAPLHFCDSSVAFATVNNTDRIIVNGGFAGYILDYSQGFLGPGFTPESDGVSEIEIQVKSSFNTSFGYVGGSGADTVRTGGSNAFRIGVDEDVDANIFDPVSNEARASRLEISGGSGNDFVSGRGLPGAFGGDVKVPMVIHGDAGDDTLVDGAAGGDFLFGEAGNDTLFTADGHNGDFITGGANFDTVTADQGDGVDSSEAVTRVGKPRIAKAVVSARPGKTAHLSLGWTHPKAWKELRKLSVGLFLGAKPLGTVDVRPADGHLTARGALKLARGSKVGHHGKTVTARLALRIPRSLAGHDIRVAVTATDRHGNSQVAPELMTLRVTR